MIEVGAVRRILPDGSVDLVWYDDRELFVAGPETGPVRRELRSSSLVVGLRFRPGLAGGALGLHASELRDMRVPLDAVWSDGTTALAERLAAATTPIRPLA